METSTHLFVYGSLTRPGALDDAIGRRHPGERLRARLPGFEWLQPASREYPCVVARPGAATEGILVMDLSDDDLHRVDEYEEVETGEYRRELVEVEAAGCGPAMGRVTAWCYVAGPRLLERLGAGSSDASDRA